MARILKFGFKYLFTPPARGIVILLAALLMLIAIIIGIRLYHEMQMIHNSMSGVPQMNQEQRNNFMFKGIVIACLFLVATLILPIGLFVIH